MRSFDLRRVRSAHLNADGVYSRKRNGIPIVKLFGIASLQRRTTQRSHDPNGPRCVSAARRGLRLAWKGPQETVWHGQGEQAGRKG